MAPPHPMPPCLRKKKALFKRIKAYSPALFPHEPYLKIQFHGFPIPQLPTWRLQWWIFCCPWNASPPNSWNLWIKLYAKRIEVKILLVPMMPCAASSVRLAALERWGFFVQRSFGCGWLDHVRHSVVSTYRIFEDFGGYEMRGGDFIRRHVGGI